MSTPLPHGTVQLIQLQIETIAACNARCVFCTYPTMKRQHGLMGMDLYEKILDDSREFPAINEISLQGLGEPLLDRFIVERVRLAHRYQPNAIITMYTNASRLTVELGLALRDAGLTALVVSLTGTSAEQRQAAMKLGDYERVVTVVDELRTKMYLKVKLIQSRDLIEPGDEQRFAERWGKDTFVTYEGNWAGQLTKLRGAPHIQPCHRALGQVMVLWDGRVAICCFDGEGEEIFGDTKSERLFEVWNSPRAKQVRQLHLDRRRAEIPICKGCTGI